jgi:assimilatory nitrate reductase catalytic subunit
MHWTDRFAARARIDTLVTAETDPHSGQPALKMAEVAIAPYKAAWHGFAISSREPFLSGIGYWALARAEAGWRLELADRSAPEDWNGFVRQTFSISDNAQLLSVHDAHLGTHNFALVEDRRLVFALFVSPEPVAVSRQWAAGQLVATHEPATRARLLAGRPSADMPDTGAIVCSCHSVGANAITDAVVSGGCLTVDQIGEALKAGTNCGSCRAEIKEIINANALQAAE